MNKLTNGDWQTILHQGKYRKEKKMEYTKGNWRVCPYGDGDFCIETPLGTDICRVHHYSVDKGEEIARATAQRIVDCVNGCEGINPLAVKDLYEAALAVLFIPSLLSDHPATTALKRAIAKAEEV